MKLFEIYFDEIITISLFLCELTFWRDGSEGFPMAHERRSSARPKAPPSTAAELFFFYSTVINKLFWDIASLLFNGTDNFLELDAFYSAIFYDFMPR